MNRHLIRLTAMCALLCVSAFSVAVAADAVAGREAFKQQCLLCHTVEPNDNGGAQGPPLIGIYGKPAATISPFSYTAALRDAKLTWDADTLNRFLASPTTVVPGSSMVVPVATQTDRDDLIAYFISVKDVVASISNASMLRDTAEWRKDAPGRVHRIELNKLPPPFDTPTIRNAPKLIERPANAAVALPPGFKTEVFARDLQGPRRIIVAPNGDVLVTETRAGRISVLRRDSATAVTAQSRVFVEGLRQPFGLAFYPNEKNPRWVYVAETHRVVRYPYRSGDLQVRGAAEVVVASLPNGRGHFTRDLVFSPNGKRMYVAVGSTTNVAEQMAKKSMADIKTWEAEHGLGALWDIETDRAAVLVYDVGSDKSGKIFAAGLRNCVSLTLQPKTNDLWCTVNERDLLGDDLVPDYSTRVKEGGFYGWPWYYMGDNEDPRLKGERPDLRGKALMPDVLFQAHSAPLHLTFYPKASGKAAFPDEYTGDAIVAFHGSWNRNFRTGYKLVRVRMKNGVPSNEYEDFMTGFIVDDGNVWGRPVATAVMQDGSLLVSDDGANQIHRVYYQR
jgi:glucose/arabinose dehydrogenase/cytochrome c2